jgi:alkylation response protein AidB-like acyl-CoA dehydrogenase
MTSKDLSPSDIGPSDRVLATSQAFTQAVQHGDLDLPLPGGGQTRARWSALAHIAERDLCVGRLAEAHVDALAILSELNGPIPATGSRWGVWASHPPNPALEARRDGDTWTLRGTKPWCSGARICTHALVTADAPDGYRLFAVELGTETSPRPGTFAAVGMAGSDSLAVDFADSPAVPVGGPGGYLERPGFWHGAISVAACWYGGAVGLARTLVAQTVELGPHALAQLGAIDASLSGLSGSFDVAAEQVDADPLDRGRCGELRAARLRVVTERVATEVLERVGRALGAGPFGLDPHFAALAADLPVYLRQSHAEADLERLGSLVLERGSSW